MHLKQDLSGHGGPVGGPSFVLIRVLSPWPLPPGGAPVVTGHCGQYCFLQSCTPILHWFCWLYTKFEVRFWRKGFPFVKCTLMQSHCLIRRNKYLHQVEPKAHKIKLNWTSPWPESEKQSNHRFRKIINNMSCNQPLKTRCEVSNVLQKTKTFQNTTGSNIGRMKNITNLNKTFLLQYKVL